MGFLLIILITNTIWGRIREGLASDKSPPKGPPRSYLLGPDPPLNPPSIPKPKVMPPPKHSPYQKDSEGNIIRGKNGKPIYKRAEPPPYCDCIDSKSRQLQFKNVDLFADIQKKIQKLTAAVKKSDKIRTQTTKNIAKTRSDDRKMCCEANWQVCNILNKYGCPSSSSESESESEEQKRQKTKSTKPSSAALKAGVASGLPSKL